MAKLIGIVLAGGLGERFWPLSTSIKPKQLLNLVDPDHTMLHQAVDRVRPIFGDDIFISTAPVLREAVEESEVLPQEKILTEPARRNTLGAIVWAVAEILARGHTEATIGILTSDHRITGTNHFLGTLRTAIEIAEKTSGIVTIGVEPNRPETGYGYIEIDRSKELELDRNTSAFRSKRFLEKPSAETAEEFIRAGNHLWNAGMFFFSIQPFLQQLSAADPRFRTILDSVAEAIATGDHAKATQEFENLPNISFDFAVMAKAENVYVVPATFGWDDVGAWDALARSMGADDDGNTLKGRVVAIDAADCMVVNEDDDRVVGVVGIEGLVVVATKDAVLVCPKTEAQRVKQIAEMVRLADPNPKSQ